MSETFQQIIKSSEALNSKIFTLTRIKIIHSLFYLGPDGATFRELSVGLGIPDGLLYSNLKTLERMGILGSEKVILEGKELESYHITDEGANEWKKGMIWLKKFLNYNIGG